VGDQIDVRFRLSRYLAAAAAALSAALIVVDGNTVKVDGRSYRLIGYDTPETYFANCENERRLGEAATARLRALIATEARLEPNGQDCKWGRECARLFGEDVRDVMLREGLARPYAGRGPRTDWCN
jgi:micrococcal nuclease